MDKSQRQAKRRQDKKVRRRKRQVDPRRHRKNKTEMFERGFESMDWLLARTKED